MTVCINLLQQCYTTTEPFHPSYPSHPIVFVGLIVVICLSIQDSCSLKQNEIFLWDVSVDLKAWNYLPII